MTKVSAQKPANGSAPSLQAQLRTDVPAENYSQIASFTRSICNLLHDPYKRNEYRKVILPLTVLRRFDCILVPTKTQVLKAHAVIGKIDVRAKSKTTTLTP